MKLATVTVLGALALVLISAPTPASAQCRVQYQADLSGETGGSLVLLCGPQPIGTPKSKSKPKPKAKPTRAQLRTLKFRPVARVSAQVRQEFVQRLATGPDAPQIKATFESGLPLREAQTNLRTLGWSTRDLVDVYSHTLLILWLATNDKRSTPRAVDRAVRADVRDRLGLDRRLRRLSDAKQQAYAERLGTWTAVIAGSLQEFRRRGDVGELNRFRETARRLARSSDLLGLDLTRVKLTRQGIVSRG